MTGSARTLTELAERCENVLEELTEFERDGLYLWDFTQAPPRLRMLYAHGFSAEERVVAERTALDRHPGWVLRTGQPLWIADTRLAGPDSPSADTPGSIEMRSRLWLPVTRDGETFGAFGVASSKPDAFDEHDRDVVQFVVDLAAVAYQRIRAEHVADLEQKRAQNAEREAARRHAELEHARAGEEARRFGAALLAIHRGADLEPGPFLRLVTKELSRAMDVPRVSVWQLASDEIVALDLLDVTATEPHTAGARLAEKDFAPYFAALRSAEPIVADDARSHPATGVFTSPYLDPLGISSMLDVPLRTLDGVRGVMCAESRAPRTWRPAEVELFREAGALVVQALDRVARQRADARHGIVLASVRDAVIACDAEHRLTLVNPVAERLTGWTASAAIGRRIDDVLRFRVDPSDASATLSLAEALAGGGGPQIAGEAWLIRGDGSLLPVACTAAPVVEDGATTGVVITVRDVTEQRLRTQALNDERERLATLLDATSAILYSMTLPDGKLEYVSESSIAVLGWSVAEQQAPGFLQATLHDDDRDRYFATLHGDASAERHVREFRQRHRDGRWVWLHDEIRILRDSTGAPVRAIGASFDVTSRKSDEQTLRALNKQLERRARQQRDLLDFSSDLARAQTRDDILRLVGQRLRAALGANQASIIQLEPEGDAFCVIELEDARAVVTQPTPLSDLAGTATERALSTGQAVTTSTHAVSEFTDWTAQQAVTGHDSFAVVPLVGGAGPFGTMNVSLTPNIWPDDSELAWIAQFAAVLAAELARQDAEQARSALLLDLEERVEARTRDLLASEQRFEELFRSTPQGLLIVDGSNQIIQSNRSAQEMFGFAEAEFPGVAIASLVPQEHRARHDGLTERYRSAPEVRPMSANSNGEPRVVSALRRDGSRFLADIRLVPVTVGDSHQVLVALADVTKQVHDAEAIARSLTEKETLLKEIHHRVKNNLQIISSLLMLQSDRMPSDDARAMLQESMYRVRSMALIHEQLYGVDSLARIDLGSYVRTLGDSLRSALAPHAVMQVHAESVEVAVDVAVPLGLVLNELLTNAFKYGIAPPGATRPAGADVSIGIASDQETISVVVADNGPGLPAGFEVTRATSLGLHLVRSLARQLRARLTTHVGPGTRFALVIPRNPAS